jgi:hypothetical protein
MSEQTSRKSGMKSSAKKLQPGSRARFGFDPAPASQKVPGAFGKERDEMVSGMSGRSQNVKRDKARPPKTRTAGEG